MPFKCVCGIIRVDLEKCFNDEYSCPSTSICAGPPVKGPAECGGHGTAGGPGSSPPATAAEQRPAAAHLAAGQTDPGTGDQDVRTKLQ